MNKSMWELIKENCNHDKKEIAKLLIHCAIAGVIGAAWFYIMALGVLLIGG